MWIGVRLLSFQQGTAPTSMEGGRAHVRWLQQGVEYVALRSICHLRKTFVFLDSDTILIIPVRLLLVLLKAKTGKVF